VTTYVVGLDGSEHARAALEWARSVALQDEQIIAAHSWEVPITSGYEAVAPVDAMDVEGMARQFLDSEVQECADRRVVGHLVTGHAGRGLVDLAEATDGPVTIVVGHGGSSKASLLLGSTAHYVIHHTQTPVVVVRGEVRLPVRRIVVGLDEHHDRADDASLHALRWAAELPGVEEIQASHADFVPGVAAGPVREPGVESEEEIQEEEPALRAAIAQVTGGTGTPPNGARIVPVITGGTGAFALIEASREVDLVVIGSRGRRGLVELITGSTGLDVLAHAHCPVAVVR
jgi:nucleotide-binding universal stress UspA family protein